MKRFLRQFHRDTCGAVTVDWVVLTAIVVSLGILAAGNIVAGISTTSANIQIFMDAHEPFLPPP